MFSFGDVVLIAFVVMVAVLPDMDTLAPKVRSRDSIFFTSLMAGIRRMMTLSRVSRQAASMGNTAFLDVLILHDPKSGPPPVIIRRLPFLDEMKVSVKPFTSSKLNLSLLFCPPTGKNNE